MKDHKKDYFYNAAWLTIITLFEVWIVGTNLDRIAMVTILIAFTVTKMMLVALIYMHLRYETKLLRRLIVLPIPLALFFLWGVVYDLSFNWTI